MTRLALILCLACLGCPLPPSEDCTPGAYRCAGDRPEVCGGAPTRWTPTDGPCSRLGRVCGESAGASGRTVTRCVVLSDSSFGAEASLEQNGDAL